MRDPITTLYERATRAQKGCFKCRKWATVTWAVAICGLIAWAVCST